MKIVQAIKKLNSISRARLNFRRRPFCVQLCIETLCKRAILVAHLTNFSFEFLWNFHRRCVFTSSIPWCKKSQKWPKTQIKGGPALTKIAVEPIYWACGHYVIAFKIQWKPFWRATQLYPQNNWAGWQLCVNYDVLIGTGPIGKISLYRENDHATCCTITREVRVGTPVDRVPPSLQ